MADGDRQPAGAGGNLGLDIARQAPPDDCTLVMGRSGNLAINPSSARSCIRSAKDVAPVALSAQYRAQ